jgi:hypothetical protein
MGWSIAGFHEYPQKLMSQSEAQVWNRLAQVRFLNLFQARSSTGAVLQRDGTGFQVAQVFLNSLYLCTVCVFAGCIGAFAVFLVFTLDIKKNLFHLCHPV